MTSRTRRFRVLGVTLIELMVGIALLGIIATLTLPSFTAFLDRSRLDGAIKTLDADLQWARGEAVKRNAVISVAFSAGLPWTYTLRNADGSTIKTVLGSQFHNTTLNTPVLGGGSVLTLQPNRGGITTGDCRVAWARSPPARRPERGDARNPLPRRGART